MQFWFYLQENVNKSYDDKHLQHCLSRNTSPICQDVNIDAATSAGLRYSHTTVNKQAQVPHNNVIYCCR